MENHIFAILATPVSVNKLERTYCVQGIYGLSACTIFLNLYNGLQSWSIISYFPDEQTGTERSDDLHTLTLIYATHIQIHVHTFIHIHSYTHVLHTFTYRHTYTHSHTLIHTFTHIHTNTFTYTYTHSHTHHPGGTRDRDRETERLGESQLSPCSLARD